MRQWHNDYPHQNSVVCMLWVSASASGHAILSKEKYRDTSQMIWLCPIPWAISKDESYDLTVSYSLRNIERRVSWFECGLSLDKFWKIYQMIWRCPLRWEILRDGSEYLPVSSSLKTGRMHWYMRVPCSIHYMHR